MRNAAEIVGLDGVDLVFVGTTDLGLALAEPEQLEPSIAAIRAAALEADKPWGIAIAADAPIEAALDAELILLASDVSLIARGIDRAVASLRELKGATWRDT